MSWRESDAGKPVLAVVMTATGIPQPLPRWSRASRRIRLSGVGCTRARAGGGACRVAAPSARHRADRLRHRSTRRPRPSSSLRSRAATTSGSRRPRRGRCSLAYGIPLVPERIAGSADEAVAAARELGFPVVVKTALAGAHKTDVGGLALDLEDEDAVRAAVERIGAPVLVQPMVKGSAELLAGIVQDPVFGPLVAFGPGGVLAELIGEAGFRIAPLTDQDAEELVLGGKSGALVRGFRGAPAADSRAPRRPRASTRPPRRRPARGQGARPQPRDRAARRLRRRRLPGSRAAARARRRA